MLTELSWELGIYALYWIWHERYLWHPFYRKLGQLIDLVLFFLYFLCWPCDMVIKICQPGTYTHYPGQGG